MLGVIPVFLGGDLCTELDASKWEIPYNLAFGKFITYSVLSTREKTVVWHLSSNKWSSDCFTFPYFILSLWETKADAMR